MSGADPPLCGRGCRLGSEKDFYIEKSLNENRDVNRPGQKLLIFHSPGSEQKLNPPLVNVSDILHKIEATWKTQKFKVSNAMNAK